MYRKPNRASGVCYAASDCLANPPGGVRGELEALAPVELFNGVHEAEVALLDQVEERQTRGLVLFRDRHDETQVRLDERALGLFTSSKVAIQLTTFGWRDFTGLIDLGASFSTLFDRLRESDLVVLGQQRVLADICEIQPDKIFFVPLDTLFRQEDSPI